MTAHRAATARAQAPPADLLAPALCRGPTPSQHGRCSTGARGAGPRRSEVRLPLTADDSFQAARHSVLERPRQRRGTFGASWALRVVCVPVSSRTRQVESPGLVAVLVVQAPITPAGGRAPPRPKRRRRPEDLIRPPRFSDSSSAIRRASSLETSGEWPPAERPHPRTRRHGGGPIGRRLRRADHPRCESPCPGLFTFAFQRPGRTVGRHEVAPHRRSSRELTSVASDTEPAPTRHLDQGPARPRGASGLPPSGSGTDAPKANALE